MNRQNFAAIILAGGVGKRMKSETPKILHPIGNQPMILRSYKSIKRLKPKQIIIVANPQNLAGIKKLVNSEVDFAVQKQPMGTADAAQVGLKIVKEDIDSIIIANGDDSAFYNPETLKKIVEKFKDANSVLTLTTVNLANPEGLGRVIRRSEKIMDIVEEKDANKKQRKIKEVNAGFYIFNRGWLESNLPNVELSTETGEKYLVSLVKIVAGDNQEIAAYNLPKDEWHGVNTQEELKHAQQKLQKRIHIMGAAGSGASAIAGIAKGYGYEVSGCDINLTSSYTKNLNLSVDKGHDESHVHNIGALIVSPAILKYDPKNAEIKKAKLEGVPVYTWQEFQGKFLQKDKFVVSVAGAYGKSTTTAMISKILADCGLDPTCEVGAVVLEWGNNFRVGKSKYYVNEADEYNNNFLNYKPDIAVVLNVGWDHPDFFKSEKSVFNSFVKFVKNMKKNGYLIVPYESNVNDLVKQAGSRVNVVRVSKFKKFNLSIIGDFRQENAQVALTVAKILKLDIKKAIKSVEGFKGVGRRLEYKGVYKGVKFFDDYAVQPRTIKTTANALKKLVKNKRVALVLEPHTYSRIKAFFEDFVKNLKATQVDRILITDVYAAREKSSGDNLALDLAKKIGPKAEFCGSISDTAEYVAQNLGDFDVVCSMGAGDSYKFYDLVKKV